MTRVIDSTISMMAKSREPLMKIRCKLTESAYKITKWMSAFLKECIIIYKV